MLAQVLADAERRAVGGEDDRTDRGVLGDLGQRVAQGDLELERQRVAGVRPVQPDGGDGLGIVTLDCDALEVPDDGQVLIVYSAAPGSSDAEKLDLLRVVGLQRV